MGVALCYFTLSRLTIFPDVSLMKLEDSFNPLFKAVPSFIRWHGSGNERTLQTPTDKYLLSWHGSAAGVSACCSFRVLYDDG